MLVSALSILPVVFVTLTPTSFVIDDEFIAALRSSKYKQAEIVEIDGKKKTRRTAIHPGFSSTGR